MSTTLNRAILQLQRLNVRHNLRHVDFHTAAVLGVKQSDCVHNTGLSSAKIDQKKRKIKREIGRLERRQQRILKPVEEKIIWPKLKREIKDGIRTRDKEIYSIEEKDSQDLLLKEWGKYKKNIVDNENAVIQRVTKCQERALNKLREESEELYIKAIQLDDSLMDVKLKGPVETPPKHNYDPQDGLYEDLTEYFTTEKQYIPDEKTEQAFQQAMRKKAAAAKN